MYLRMRTFGHAPRWRPSISLWKGWGMKSCCLPHFLSSPFVSLHACRFEETEADTGDRVTVNGRVRHRLATVQCVGLTATHGRK